MANWWSTTMIGSAEKHAEEMHQGQYRKVSNAPYITHPRQVATIVRSHLGLYPNTQHVIVSALLHDVMEDCAITRDWLVAWYGEAVAEIVDSVSRLDGETRSQMLERLVQWESEKYALSTWVVFIADKIANLQDIVYCVENYTITRKEVDGFWRQWYWSCDVKSAVFGFIEQRYPALVAHLQQQINVTSNVLSEWEYKHGTEKGQEERVVS